MAKEQTFKSPGFFETETVIEAKGAGIVGIPYGIIGTAKQGPAFVPVTVGSIEEFEQKFGPVSITRPGTFAAREVLASKGALTYMRVLGAGANTTISHMNITRDQGRVYNAGFVVTGNIDVGAAGAGQGVGAVQFIVANHTMPANEAFGYPMFTKNSSITTATANLIRGMVFMASGARLQLLNGSGQAYANTADCFADPTSDRLFKLVISSNMGSTFGNDDSKVGAATALGGLRIITASLDPASVNYIGNVLNTDPKNFAAAQHLLYADFAVENEVAPLTVGTNTVAIVSGSSRASSTSGDTTKSLRAAYGHFDTRYRAAKTPSFISQPFGTTEYDLFSFEAINDGELANTSHKISIVNIKASIDTKKPFGTFTVNVREFNDTDLDQRVVEQFVDCNLDPASDRYIGRMIGDRKVYFNFDADQESERRLIATGKFSNKSSVIRVKVNADVENGNIPQAALPFGFRGINALKTTDYLWDRFALGAAFGPTYPWTGRLTGSISPEATESNLTGSIVPPLPFRFKVTRGASATTGYVGNPGVNEIVDSRYHWGVKFERAPREADITNAVLNANASAEQNPLITAYTKFVGIKELDVLITGSLNAALNADKFNDNKFTLARIALSDTQTGLSGSVNDYMRNAAYIRNAPTDPSTGYRINDGTISNRVTFATIINTLSASVFNKFSDYMKFTTIMQGGFDGVNILDPDAAVMNDRSTAGDTWGGGESSYRSPGLSFNANGSGSNNNATYAYRTAARIMTDPLVSNVNIIAVPGIRDSIVTDYVANKTKDYGLAMYVMDIPGHDDADNRVYDSATTMRPDVEKTRLDLDARGVDNNYIATYFPDVMIKDVKTGNNIMMPASVAALSALAFNDKVGYPWFAPAGFNRASLDNVVNTQVRLNSTDRDNLYSSRINPIASFPRQGFVIFGQKTLQKIKSALDRVNVRRLMVDIKRSVISIAQRRVFEQNTVDVRKQFAKEVIGLLSTIQARAGIEQLRVIIDETNNKQTDIDNNVMNGRIVVVPTRAVEFIAIDFIVTNTGVSFA